MNFGYQADVFQLPTIGNTCSLYEMLKQLLRNHNYKQSKTTFMRKILILTSFVYLTSCGSNTSNETKKTDTTATASTVLPNDTTVATKSDTAMNSAVTVATADIIADPTVVDAMKNFAWQWRNAKEGTNIEIGVNGITIYASDKNYSVLTALGTSVKGDDENGFNMMLNGQRHAPSIQDQYKGIWKKYGSKKFWELVCSSSYDDHKADLNDARANITWLKTNNSESYTNAKRDFGNKNYPNAMYWLMWGQRHNPSIMETFRATFRDQKDNFIQLLQ